MNYFTLLKRRTTAIGNLRTLLKHSIHGHMLFNNPFIRVHFSKIHGPIACVVNVTFLGPPPPPLPPRIPLPLRRFFALALIISRPVAEKLFALSELLLSGRVDRLCELSPSISLSSTPIFRSNS